MYLCNPKSSKLQGLTKMIRLFVLFYLLAAVAAQKTYYCTHGGTGNITEQDFYFVTRRGPHDHGYRPNMICELNLTPGTGIMLDIQSFNVFTAVLTVTDGTKTLFNKSRLYDYQSSMVATSDQVRIRFNSTGDYSGSTGVSMRIRFFDSNRCPPGWAYLYGTCFGTSNVTGRLDYHDAQKACNSMRANLLQIPSGYTGKLGSFMRLLPHHLKRLKTWIGLTDRGSYGIYQYTPFWLNGEAQYSTSEIGCGRVFRPYSSCYLLERCGALDPGRSSRYSIYMSFCWMFIPYACSMPPGGSEEFYLVPEVRGIVYPPEIIYKSVLWSVVVGSLFIVSLIIGAIYAGLRSKIRRTGGPNSVLVTAGRVRETPIKVTYRAQKYLQPLIDSKYEYKENQQTV